MEVRCLGNVILVVVYLRSEACFVAGGVASGGGLMSGVGARESVIGRCYRGGGWANGCGAREENNACF